MSDHDDAEPGPPDSPQIEHDPAKLEPPPPFRPDRSLITYIERRLKPSRRKRSNGTTDSASTG